MSITEARKVVQVQHRIIRSFPEVVSVFGKNGRAETATDSAPMEMGEATIVLKPESQWRPGMTSEKLIDEMDHALKIPGISNSWTQPIRGRIDMLSTGIRTPVGIKILWPKLEMIES